jgi:hypothetical protein
MARVRGVIACLLALFLWGGASVPATAGFPPAGFAIWPEDNEPAAAAACADRGEDESWRTDASASAEQFTRDELGWTSPSAGEAPDDSSSVRLLVYDEDAPGIFLGIVMDLFRYNDCWYVEYVFPREGAVPHLEGFTEVDGITHLLLRAWWFGDLFVDYGFGDENDVLIEGDEQLLIPVEGETDTGHFFFYDEDQPDMNVEGHTLPAPMDPSTADPASGHGGYAMWPFHEVGRYSGVNKCKRDWMHDPERVVKTFVRYIGKGTVLRRQDRAHWIAQVDDARFRVVLRHVRHDCWPVRRVESLDRVIHATIRPAEPGYTVDFEWGDAATADITLNYGGLCDGAFLEHLTGPFTEPQVYDFSQQGAYWIVLSDADGRVVGVEGSRLGPID